MLKNRNPKTNMHHTKQAPESQAPTARKLPALATAALIAAAITTPAAQAQSYPQRAIQLIAQQPPGSGSDAMTRA